ncbi:hypothetical protein DPEC_G00184170 [Dallia pectoralis]|uniref:Uncharacterized protein n=1 Tax=Dallia pectoralis TaxID=75939 RepID=A0ACC2GAV2_DALPE|nr:hypothetical protein DPEC_G00184170 [Dallia pectoralis]
MFSYCLHTTRLLASFFFQSVLKWWSAKWQPAYRYFSAIYWTGVWTHDVPVESGAEEADAPKNDQGEAVKTKVQAGNLNDTG